MKTVFYHVCLKVLLSNLLFCTTTEYLIWVVHNVCCECSVLEVMRTEKVASASSVGTFYLYSSLITRQLINLNYVASIY